MPNQLYLAFDLQGRETTTRYDLTYHQLKPHTSKELTDTFIDVCLFEMCIVVQNLVKQTVLPPALIIHSQLSDYDCGGFHARG